MKNVYPVLLIFIFAIGCRQQNTLPEGRWTGTLTPMNHPEMHNPLAYDVGYANGALQVAVVGPDSAAVPAQDVRIANDTLYFAFAEPEQNVRLECALGRNKKQAFSGRCTDPNGKWARFTMQPPTKG